MMFLNSIYCNRKGNKKETKCDEKREWPNDVKLGSSYKEEEKFLN